MVSLSRCLGGVWWCVLSVVVVRLRRQSYHVTASTNLIIGTWVVAALLVMKASVVEELGLALMVRTGGCCGRPPKTIYLIATSTNLIIGGWHDG